MTTTKKIHPEEWHLAVEQMRKFTVRIDTKDGVGTGFACVLYPEEDGTPTQCIVTAAHVVGKENKWDEPIYIENVEKKRKIKLMRTKGKDTDDYGEHEGWRAVTNYGVVCLDDADKDTDIAIIVFDSCKNYLKLPKKFPKQLPADQALPPGMEIGWLGYPGVGLGNLCFFSGRISCWFEEWNEYWVDGGAMRGVSGGPAFVILDDGLHIIGLVTAQRLGVVEEGETGLCVVEHIERAQQITNAMADRAKRK